MSLDNPTPVDSDEREAFREVARDYLTKASDSDRVRAVVAAGGDRDEQLQAQAARMGWFGLEIAEEHGGAGGEFADLVVLLEEGGGAISSLSLVSTSVLCAGAILLSGSDQQQIRWLPALAEGATSGTAVLPGLFDRTATPRTVISASATDTGFLLHGTARDVIDGRSSDIFVVAGSDGTPDGTVVGVVSRGAAGLSVEARPMVDLTRALDIVRLDGVLLQESDVLARGKDAQRLLTALINRAAVATAADSLGVGRRVLAMTVAYAKQREQFGRAIGSFQAVKHQAVNAHVDNEVSSGLLAAAAQAVGIDPSTPETSVKSSMAKSHACAAGGRSSGVAVQLHGGIGYTWEHDLHLYLKRSSLNEELFGSDAWHSERIARNIL